MEKNSQEALQWFVDFANMNLEVIKPGDKAKLLVESEEYLFPNKEISEWADSPIPLSKRDKEIVAWAFTVHDKQSDQYWSIILRLHHVVQDHLLKLLASGPYITSVGDQKILTRIVWGAKLPLTITEFPVTESQDEYIRFKIFRLLKGFLLGGHTIGKCPGCKKFFFNPTRRKKAFCSPKCMWRVNTAKRRESDREGYNEYQAKLMKDRYREEHGHPRLKTKPRKTKKGK